MMNSTVKDAALNNIELLKKVVEFKEKFYRCPWAKYEEGKIGTIKLMPPKINMQALKDDYEHMQNMIFGEKYDCETILTELKKFEDELNSTTAKEFKLIQNDLKLDELKNNQ